MHISIQVRVMGSLREIMGKTLQKRLLKGSTIKDLLKNLSNDFDAQIKEKFMHTLLEMSSTLFILLNDSDISLFENEHTKLSDGDVVTILPIIHGG